MTTRKINGNTYSEFAIVAAAPIPVDIEGATLSLSADGVEIKNDVGNPIPVDDAGGSLTVDDGGGSLTVDGPLTDAELRATAVPVSGTVNVLTGLEIPEHDYIDLSYTGSNLTGVVYKTGGSGGTTVATLTLAYDGNDNLISRHQELSHGSQVQPIYRQTLT
jgi:hypothetical protein